MLHELTHGLSNRLHGNSAGLSTNMSRGLGEGWSDFYARALLSDASEPVSGLYTTGGWATDAAAAGFENYYYGIRRFPYAVKTTLGANGRPHNPLTFADIDSTQADLTDGAYPASTAFGSATRDQVHEVGQIWAMMLLEVRARFITRLGFTEGNRRILQFVTDGMKGDPVGPTFLTARDSIVAAANAGGGTQADIDDIWAGFATRGLGVLAQVLDQGTGSNNARVVENYLRPSDPVPTFTINDVSATEGNVGTKTFAFTVSLANPSGTSTVSYATANGTATAATGSPVGTSSGPISLPAGAPGTSSGPAGPYPATLNLAGLTGTITSLSVRLNGLTHTFPSDLDMLLVAPGGQRSMFMSDVGGSAGVSNLTLTFQDGAPAPPAALVAGTYAPTDLPPADTMAAPAPAGPYTSALSAFNGTNPNGTWSLYIVDDSGADSGSLTSFTLLMATTTTVADYQATSGVLSFPPGTTSLPVNVTVIGDTTPEPHETFLVNLTNPANAVIADAQGMGTILNDDGTPPTATNDAYSTPFATVLTVPDPGVLGNDAANGGGALTAAVVTSTSHGTLNLVPGGGFSLHAGGRLCRHRQLHLSRAECDRSDQRQRQRDADRQPAHHRAAAHPVLRVVGGGQPGDPALDAARHRPGAHRLHRRRGRQSGRGARQSATRPAADLHLRRADRRVPGAGAVGVGCQREWRLERSAALRQRGGASVGTGEPARPRQRQHAGAHLA